ncbi:MAG: sigma-54-dependent Fis family transcriptional regulator [Deltaproteobacteria bacterium]|nr:sigma-54-dependent Fis family transcriptional regulator [Deltaproteobacteria bacterium]
MVVDENRFFQEVSIRICGSLEIDKALLSCFQYVSGVMPVDELIITIYDPAMKCVKNIATADAQGAHLTSEEIPLTPLLPGEAQDAERLPRFRKLDNALDDPIIRRLAQSVEWPPSSVLINRLMIEGKYVGSFLAVVRGEGRYTDEDLRIWSLVNEPAAIALANHLQYREVIRVKDLLADDKHYLQDELRKGLAGTLVGADFGLREVMEKVRRVAPLLSPVLLVGETGTGKEVIANALHELSNRNKGPLIKVNCGAIPETLIDSELFGHERGAFTGAIAQKRGRFERAAGGTIFLDEVSELPPQVQIRLLRVLQEKEIERVGGQETISVNVRIVSATNRDLEALVKKGQFREDLYFRLNIFPVKVPPLRERKNDIPLLVQHFIRKKAQEMVLPDIPAVAPGEIDRLMQYDWPGNVRELENAVERAIILARGEHLIFGQIIEAGEPLDPRPPENATRTQRLDEVEARHIEAVLASAGGRISGKGGAADLLGINPNTLRHRMRKLGIRFGRK